MGFIILWLYHHVILHKVFYLFIVFKVASLALRNPYDCLGAIEVNLHKNIERHTAHTIVSWPNPKQWVIVNTSDLIMIIRQSTYIISIITREVGTQPRKNMITMGKVNTSDLMMIITWAIDISFQSPILKWASWTHKTPYIVMKIKGNR